ncbi:MAG TPA: hypothetical protein DCX17_03070 [Firmicutes bacterium]|jgi:zinc transport system substrate-binding protein|nr:hypothetical protein [Bacillota bacterium]
MKQSLLKYALLPLLLLSGCQQGMKADIVVTMFPQEDISKAIVGDKLSVHSILPLGVDVHDFEASSRDIVSLNDARLVIHTSPIIDTWFVEDQIQDENTTVIDLSTYYTPDETLPSNEQDHEDDFVHYWVDPLVIVDLTLVILEEIVALDPINETFYTANAQDYVEDLIDTHGTFMDYLTAKSFLDSTIYFAGHNAMGLFGLRHQLDIHPLFSDFKPDEDLSSGQLIEFVTAIKETGTHFLFVEAMVNPKAALTIKDELSKEDYALTLLELHSFHNRSTEDAANNVTYLDIYKRNIANIKVALEG